MVRLRTVNPQPRLSSFSRLAMGVVSAFALAPGLFAQSTGVKPNIVYILADDLGYGDIQALNPTRGKIATPNLDRMLQQGMHFTDAHSGSSVCTPTRYGLLTGRYAWRTRLQKGVLDGTDDPPLIGEDTWTVGSLLQRQGYATATIGKWHLGFHSVRPDGGASVASNDTKHGKGGLPVGSKIVDGPLTRGFHYFWGCSNARTMSGLIENDRVIEKLEPIDMLPRLGARAVEYIEEQATTAANGRPFFLYLPLTSPHTPIVPAAEWQGKSNLGSYGDFVMQTDAVVGQVMAALDRLKLSDQTLVFFTADNGCSPAAGTPALEAMGHFASGPYRGYKADIWEGGHRVPFIAKWPGRIAAGATSSQLICHVDLMATCAELLNIALPTHAAVDSFSFLPALIGTKEGQPRQVCVHHSIEGKFAIREGRWKLILAAGSGGWSLPKDQAARASGAPPMQLYDLEQDPGERTNLFDENPEIAARLKGTLERYVRDGRSTLGPPQENDSEIDIEKEASLSTKATAKGKSKGKVAPKGR